MNHEEQNSLSEVALTYGKAILIALTIAWVVRNFGLEAYRIPNAAMSPTLVPGDTVFVTKFDYGIRIPGVDDATLFERTPSRGDLVVFETRGRTPRETIKRVLGLPGDRIQIRKGEILLNGARIADATDGKCGQEKLPSSESRTPSISHSLCLESPLLPDRPETLLKESELFVAPDLRSETALLPPPSRSEVGAEEADREAWVRKDLMEHAWGVIKNHQLRGRARWIWVSITPPQEKLDAGWTARIRWNRMLRGIDTLGR